MALSLMRWFSVGSLLVLTLLFISVEASKEKDDQLVQSRLVNNLLEIFVFSFLHCDVSRFLKMCTRFGTVEHHVSGCYYYLDAFSHEVCPTLLSTACDLAVTGLQRQRSCRAPRMRQWRTGQSSSY